MSIYVARSPYRTHEAQRNASRFKITFPNLQGFFAKRATRRDRRAARIVPTANVSVPVVRARREAAFGRRTAGAVAGVVSGVRAGESFGGALNCVRGATLKFKFGPSTAIGGLMVIAILISLVYLTHFNKVATKGYDLRRLEADRQQLLNQYDIKNMKLAEVKSLAKIAGSERVSVMRRPGEIIFVRGNTALASR